MQPDPSHIYRAVFEQGPDAMVIVDTTGVIILINRKALEITGYQAAEELLGKNITHILSATDHNRFREYFGRANSSRVGEALQFSIQSKDGSVSAGELVLSPVSGACRQSRDDNSNIP